MLSDGCGIHSHPVDVLDHPQGHRLAGIRLLDRSTVEGMGDSAAGTIAGSVADIQDGRAVSGHEPDRTGSARSGAGRSPDQVPLVVTGDLELLDSILAAAAAAGIEPTVTSEAASLRPVWASAPMVIVGIDRARQVSELVLPHRTQVYVVGAECSQQQLWQWSAPLGAAVVSLPVGTGLLTAAIADLTVRPGDGGLTLAVIGGSGGIGASTLAAGLCYTAAARDTSSMLIDLDPVGGGIDLLVGAESVPGWRWPRLSRAQGHLGDLTGHLPRVAGMDVLSVSRVEEETAIDVSPDSVRAVLASARRSHRLIVADVSRTMTASSREMLRRVDQTLLVVAANVRGIAAAEQVLTQLRPATSDLGLLARMPRSGGVDASMVSQRLDLPLIGILGEDATVRLGAERGEPPGRAAKGPVAKLTGRLLDSLPTEVGQK